jgi:hypothetical protein
MILHALGMSGAKAMARALTQKRGRSDGARKRVVALEQVVARAVEQAGHVSVLAQIDKGRLQCQEPAADALCLSSTPADASLLREYTRVVKPGGRVLIAAGLTPSRQKRQQIMALFLHAGLVDLEQRRSRGILLSSGRVR